MTVRSLPLLAAVLSFELLSKTLKPLPPVAEGNFEPQDALRIRGEPDRLIPLACTPFHCHDPLLKLEQCKGHSRPGSSRHLSEMHSSGVDCWTVIQMTVHHFRPQRIESSVRS